MNDLDRKIREAIGKEDADLLDEWDQEPSIFDMLLETMRGRNRWINLLGAVWTILFMVLAVVCMVKFFGAADQRDLLFWMGGFIVCLLIVVMLKVWYWMEMQKNALLREIKRLELQIARLAGRLKR